MGKRLNTIYKILRVFIYLIPSATVIVGVFLILFPVEEYKYFSGNQSISKFNIEKNASRNEIGFGVSPLQNYKIIDLNLIFNKLSSDACQKTPPLIFSEKTYRAFLFEEGAPVSGKGELRDLLFSHNSTKFPNGSLLHLKPTDEVYLLTDGKKTLFPGPEIFRAFGYNFDYLVDVDKSTLDQFPDADNRVFLWSQSHPDGTIFQSFPSNKIYIIKNGQKLLIKNGALLDEIWPNNYKILTNDNISENLFQCPAENIRFSDKKIECRFDNLNRSQNIGRYYFFTIKFPEKCDVGDIQFREAEIDFVSEKSYATAKNSLRTIFASILNRYIYKQHY